MTSNKIRWFKWVNNLFITSFVIRVLFNLPLSACLGTCQDKSLEEQVVCVFSYESNGDFDERIVVDTYIEAPDFEF